jgi:hypothetical protein
MGRFFFAFHRTFKESKIEKRGAATIVNIYCPFCRLFSCTIGSTGKCFVIASQLCLWLGWHQFPHSLRTHCLLYLCDHEDTLLAKSQCNSPENR